MTSTSTRAPNALSRPVNDDAELSPAVRSFLDGVQPALRDALRAVIRDIEIDPRTDLPYGSATRQVLPNTSPWPGLAVDFSLRYGGRGYFIVYRVVPRIGIVHIEEI